MFENKVLRKIFGLKRVEVTGEWRRRLYSSPFIIRMIESREMRWTRLVALMGDRRGAYKGLVGRPEGKSPLGRPKL
jgi:hypothetical protein